MERNAIEIQMGEGKYLFSYVFDSKGRGILISPAKTPNQVGDIKPEMAGAVATTDKDIIIWLKDLESTLVLLDVINNVSLGLMGWKSAQFPSTTTSAEG